MIPQRVLSCRSSPIHTQSVCDCYLDSSVAYQGAARALGPTEVRDLSRWATGGLLPEPTIPLDANPALTRQRTAVRGATDRLEREPGSADTDED
ncbi:MULTISPECIES: hypothetical protein [Actinomyces]|uniref:dTMP kinase n=1 Tax=Actinomyces TaxID=1654 RepID=UPI002E2A04AB|nr:hypothetical protein [Actinomyces respiraculi]